MIKPGINIYTVISLSIAILATIIIIWYTIKSVESNIKKESIIVGLMGDVMIGRSVNKAIDKTSYAYPWGDTLSILKKNDINIINLETTLTNSTEKVPKVFNFKATPDKVKTLELGNINIANLANNHILDFSVQGLVDTIQALNSAGIKHVGAGVNKTKAKSSVIIEKDGIKIGIIGLTDNEPGWQATKEKPGTNYIKIGDIEEIKNNIKTFKNQVDIVIVSVHWGPNMRQRPTEEFKNFARQIIDAGVDIIHGHSAHIFQAIEIYKSKVILYDTGDFIDDYAVDPKLKNNQSFLFLIEVSKSGIKKVKLIPVIIKNFQVNTARGAEYKAILDKMQKLSIELGTKIDSQGQILI